MKMDNLNNDNQLNNNYNINPINTNNNENKNQKDIKFLKVMIVILFLFCIGLFVWGLNKNQNKSTKETSNSTSNEEEKVDVEISHSKVVTPATEGVYIIDVSEVVDNAMPSIVAITSKTLVRSGYYGPGFYGYNSGNRYTTGAGSGIIIGKTDTELLILTNNHVIEDAEQLSVQFINNKSVDATVKGTSSSKDVAVIAVPLKSIDDDTIKSIKIATIGSSKDLKVGQGVIAIGNALGYGQSVTTGVISALDREVTIDNVSNNMIQTDAAINGGNSGGALLNSKGEVIGINSAKYSSSGYSSQASIEGMGFAIPISDVEELINNLMNGKTLKEDERGYLGISGYMITDDYKEAYGMPKGIYIKDIVKGSGADKAKLEIGNIITEVNGTKINQFSDLTEMLETKQPGEKVELTIKYASGREYKEKKVTVTLSSYKDVN
jgi:serine protease Do